MGCLFRRCHFLHDTHERNLGHCTPEAAVLHRGGADCVQSTGQQSAIWQASAALKSLGSPGDASPTRVASRIHLIVQSAVFIVLCATLNLFFRSRGNGSQGIRAHLTARYPSPLVDLKVFCM